MSLSASQIAALGRIFDDRELLLDPVYRNACSTDASFYRLVPKAVLRPSQPDQIQKLLTMAEKQGLKLTFRGGGTSLSGQAISSEVLVMLQGQGFSKLQVLDEGGAICSGPANRGGLLNAYLRPWGRQIGPDPASLEAATLGGILSNNASGMCCGTRANSYATLSSLVFILADGYRLDSGHPQAEARFRAERPDLAQGLMDLRQRILEKPAWVEIIQRKYRIKNTSGYSLNSFLDFDTPLQILIHLLIGSEGTLGFIESATLKTLPNLAHKASAFAVFSSLHAAAQAAAQIGEMGASAIEIMDDQSLNAAGQFGALTANEPFHGQAALLIEFAASQEEALQLAVKEPSRYLSSFGLKNPAPFSTDVGQRDAWWAMRKKLFPFVGGRRPQGNALLTEDVCVQPDRMADLILDVKAIFAQHQLPDHVIFGHAKDGNLHFVLYLDLVQSAGLDRYARMMDELCHTVAKTYGGSLKAEHGTGRNIAPFLELEWGSQLYDVMRAVKQLLDPHGILNPGVLINDDPHVHLQNIKVDRPVDPLIDRCMDCGFCERVCPSRELTLTPRQRINVLRCLGKDELQRARYPLEQTCAADGMCAQACPLDIDTGKMIKKRRAQQKRGKRVWVSLAQSHFGAVRHSARLSLKMVALFSQNPLSKRVVSTAAKHLAGYDISSGLPPAQERLSLPKGPEGPNPVLYFPSCVNLTLGNGKSRDPLPHAVVKLLAHGGFSAFCPPELLNQCCGTPFFSKGFPDSGFAAQDRLFSILEKHTDRGRIPVVCDVSPCAYEMTHREKGSSVVVQDLIAFLAENLNRFAFNTRDLAVLHPTCSATKSGLVPAFRQVMGAAAQAVEIPHHWNCCGMAGDRGWLVPELVTSAIQSEAAEVEAMDQAQNAAFLSSCKTCELAMSRS
ncbi:MAG: FAD-binding oxidoreductase, partial [Acidobacteria bacterium]|nr:FAD-binding oxidoreductase [Acidobacteriota bacterium]